MLVVVGSRGVVRGYQLLEVNKSGGGRGRVVLVTRGRGGLVHVPRGAWFHDGLCIHPIVGGGSEWFEELDGLVGLGFRRAGWRIGGAGGVG